MALVSKPEKPVEPQIGLTLEQIANKLNSMNVKTIQGHDTWRIVQVSRLRKRLKI